MCGAASADTRRAADGAPPQDGKRRAEGCGSGIRMPDAAAPHGRRRIGLRQVSQLSVEVDAT